MFRKRKQHPQLTITLVDNSRLDVQTTWSPGQDLSIFAQLLVHLCSGKMIEPISVSVAVNAAQIDDFDGGAVIYSALNKLVAEAGDEPMVCPTDAVRMNMIPLGD